MKAQEESAAGPGPLEGFRVLEVAGPYSASWAGAVLAGWGADLVVVGDAGAARKDPGAAGGGRRLGLDLECAGGRGVFHDLVVRADVFLTGLPSAERARCGVELADVRRANARIVYAGGAGTALHAHGEADALPGIHLAVGVAAALLRRERTGEVPALDLAVSARTLAWWTEGHADVRVLDRPARVPSGTDAPTDEILMDLGMGWDRIIELKASGAVE
ncbi:CoA transferase [Actinocorallia herbida]|nr:CoA transferase [Actinocorallia herbida]